jgi:hypothetical protein
MNNIDEEWERIKEAITDAANEWWDEECRQCIKKKNEARSKWLQQNTKQAKTHIRR